jgi:hypothetical protein
MEKSENKKQKFLAIAGIEFANGVRILKPKKTVINQLTGCIPLNGGSGEGKSTFIEALKMATVGIDTRRDNNLVPNGQEESEWLVPIAYVDKPNEILLYIRTVVKKNGEIQQSFMVDTEKGRKTEKNPIAGMEKLTPSKLQDLMRTSLTYGIDDFLSESSTRVRDFIFKTYSDELLKLGLIVEKNSPAYGESINGRLETAIANRDEISREQSKRGAYGVNLEGFVCPRKPNIESLNEKQKEAIQKLANAKATKEAQKGQIEIRISEKQAKFDLKKNEAESVKKDIVTWNDSKLEEEKDDVNNLMKDHKSFIEQKEIINESKLFLTTDCSPEDEIFILLQSFSAIEKHIQQKLESFEKEINNRPQVLQIPLDGKGVPENLPEEAVTLLLKLQNIRAEAIAIQKEIDGIKNEPIEGDNSAVETAQAELDAVNLEIEAAQKDNDLFERFEILERHTEAERKVNELRAERNRMYTQIDCKVKGLTIGLVDEDKGTMAFYYDGRYDVEYFANPNKTPQLITSYSASQKVLISVLLQANLLKENQLPLNVLYVDNVGMDSKVRDLFDLFAKKNGLMILVAQTNDKTIDDIGSNELLIENGEVFYSEV